MKSKKGQFLIFSGAFILFSLMFIYSLETDNSYIKNSAKNHILQNVLSETCRVATELEGTELNSSLYDFSSDVSTFCSDIGMNCTLRVTNLTSIPPSGNWSLLSYTDYRLELFHQNDGFRYEGNVSC